VFGVLRSGTASSDPVSRHVSLFAEVKQQQRETRAKRIAAKGCGPRSPRPKRPPPSFEALSLPREIRVTSGREAFSSLSYRHASGLVHANCKSQSEGGGGCNSPPRSCAVRLAQPSIRAERCVIAPRGNRMQGGIIMTDDLFGSMKQSVDGDPARDLSQKALTYGIPL
jgi:hypothetical protein